MSLPNKVNPERSTQPNVQLTSQDTLPFLDDYPEDNFNRNPTQASKSSNPKLSLTPASAQPSGNAADDTGNA